MKRHLFRSIQRPLHRTIQPTWRACRHSRAQGRATPSLPDRHRRPRYWEQRQRQFRNGDRPCLSGRAPPIRVVTPTSKSPHHCRPPPVSPHPVRRTAARPTACRCWSRSTEPHRPKAASWGGGCRSCSRWPCSPCWLWSSCWSWCATLRRPYRHRPRSMTSRSCRRSRQLHRQRPFHPQRPHHQQRPYRRQRPCHHRQRLPRSSLPPRRQRPCCSSRRPCRQSWCRCCRRRHFRWIPDRGSQQRNRPEQPYDQAACC